MGNESEVLEFVRLCALIQSFGVIGTSRSIKVNVDGDGSGRLMFSSPDPVNKGEIIDLPIYTSEELGESREFEVDIGE